MDVCALVRGQLTDLGEKIQQLRSEKASQFPLTCDLKLHQDEDGININIVWKSRNLFCLNPDHNPVLVRQTFIVLLEEESSLEILNHFLRAELAYAEKVIQML